MKVRLLPPVQISTNPKVNQDAQAWAQQNNDQLERFLNASIYGSRLQWSVGTSPPASATTGDLWVYPGSGFYWLFVYDASEATNKWKFVGGPPLHITDNNNTGDSGSTVYNSIGPTLTLPRSGDYEVEWGGAIIPGTNGTYDILWGVKVGGTSTTDVQAIWIGNELLTATSIHGGLSRKRSVSGTASDLIQSQLRVTAGSAQLHMIWLEVTPVKVI